MRLLAVALALACLVGTDAKSQQVPRTTWSPAVYHGLTVGSSTRTDVLRVLGPPKSSGREQDTGIPILTYSATDPVAGTLIAYFRKNILTGITLYPRAAWSRKGIIRILGSDYLTVRYAMDDCLTEGGSAPLYESRDGPIEHMEYRDRGLAVIISDDKVEAIAYGAEPYAPTSSRCADKSRQR